MSHKVGDRVIITKRIKGHGFPIGSTVVIEMVRPSGTSYRGHLLENRYDDWYFCDDECRAEVRTNQNMANLLDSAY